MKTWWEAYLRLKLEKQILLGALILAAFPLALKGLWPDANLPAGEREGNERANGSTADRADTHIPKGFVLVPIEARNYEALDSILGRFGTVDLYQGDAANGVKQRLVARNVRILRAPQNPSHFAVLIPEREAERVLAESGPFTVTVKRPGSDGTEFVNTPPEASARRRRTITYDKD